MKQKEEIITILTILMLVSSSVNGNTTSTPETIIHLVLELPSGSPYIHDALYIAHHLRNIGIEVNVKTSCDWIWLWPWQILHNYDLFIEDLQGWGSPDMRDVYTEGGSWNRFRLGPDLPYYNQSEQIINEAVTEPNGINRIQLYHVWQNLMMDQIVPLLPLFTPRCYSCIWNNTQGYDLNWGLADSLPYMSYEGYHDGQVNLSEFNLASLNWGDLNPLFTGSMYSYCYYGQADSSRKITDLITEPILQVDPDNIPTTTGLVMDWQQVDPFHYKFFMRENVFWNPSLNITTRDAESESLLNATLMIGLKGEFSNGTNQKVSAKDAVFTLLASANSECSDISKRYNWISNCYVDKNDSLAFHIEIDGDANTPEKDLYMDFWSLLKIPLLPEFFLNSTSPMVSYTTGGAQCTGLYAEMITSPQWVAFSTSAFGCGKYLLDYFIRNSVIVLKKSPYWFGVGAIDGQIDMDLSINTLNIRVIPDRYAELAEFEVGKLDLLDLTPFTEKRKDFWNDGRWEVHSCNRESMSYLGFNLRRSTIGGEDNFIYLTESGKENYTVGSAVRKAICYAIDRDNINQEIYDGEHLISNSLMNPYWSRYYYEDIPTKYDYDLELAWEWMQAAGFQRPHISTTLLNYFQLSLILGSIVLFLIVRGKKIEKRR
ncbi:MAG: hypothetical protein E3J43_09130 [Candidatus Heimdallarchaeota archaeon]|nr:MAG: hypothetical protein E3J43_09130 [Candidatus Heimdallarchaeota archaeon]